MSGMPLECNALVTSLENSCGLVHNRFPILTAANVAKRFGLTNGGRIAVGLDADLV